MKTLNDSVDLAGATWSEKLDGVNAFWNGSELLSRDGNAFPAPAEFLAGLPAELCCGELWAGRGRFETVLSVVQSSEAAAWLAVAFVPIDAMKWRPVDRPVAALLDTVRRKGGEGIVIQVATGERYKLKPSIDDDARVIDHVAGKGRNAGIVGSLLVEDREGRRFKLSAGLTYREREVPPAIGAIVTFAFCGRTARGIPRHAVFRGCRAERSFV